MENKKELLDLDGRLSKLEFYKNLILLIFIMIIFSYATFRFMMEMVDLNKRIFQLENELRICKERNTFDDRKLE